MKIMNETIKIYTFQTFCLSLKCTQKSWMGKHYTLKWKSTFFEWTESWQHTNTLIQYKVPKKKANIKKCKKWGGVLCLSAGNTARGLCHNARQTSSHRDWEYHTLGEAGIRGGGQQG